MRAEAIIDSDDSPPPEVRVCSLKFIASVSGAPEGRDWYGTEAIE